MNTIYTEETLYLKCAECGKPVEWSCTANKRFDQTNGSGTISLTQIHSSCSCPVPHMSTDGLAAMHAYFRIYCDNSGCAEEVD